MGIFDDDMIPKDLDEDKITNIEFVSVNTTKSISTWGADVSLKISSSTGVIPTSISIGIFLDSKKIAEANPDEYGHIHIKVADIQIPKIKENVILTARVVNHNLEAKSRPFSLAIVDSKTQSNLIKTVEDILDWIEEKISLKHKYNKVLAFTIIWLVILFDLFVIAKVGRLIIKLMKIFNPKIVSIGIFVLIALIMILT